MNVRKICDKFKLSGTYEKTEKISSGNINSTFKIICRGKGKYNYYVLQKINRFVFKRPDLVMENALNITEHIYKKLNSNCETQDFKVIRYILTDCGMPYFLDGDGEYWRCYEFIQNSRTYNTTSDPIIIREAGRAFGKFQKLLSDYDVSSLYETIPNFHNTEVRFEAFEHSLELDTFNRKSDAKDEIKYLLDQKELAISLYAMLKACKIPLKVTHNDTKCNNVLFDANTKKALAVIDLDTVMAGLVAYDFGDAIRSIASTADEDETELSRISFDFNKFTAFTSGFISEVGSSLSDCEIKSLSLGVLVMTLELAARFLKDYLDGDIYFKTLYQKHNLIRARCQIALAKEIEKNLPKIERFIGDAC